MERTSRYREVGNNLNKTTPVLKPIKHRRASFTNVDVNKAVEEFIKDKLLLVGDISE